MKKYTMFKQVCNLIPPHWVNELAKEYGVDEKSRTFTPWSHVTALVYAQLTHAIGWNDVCDGLRMNQGALATIRGATPPSRNNLSHANKGRDARMAEALYWKVIGHVMSQSPGFARGKIRCGYLRRFLADEIIELEVGVSRQAYPLRRRRLAAIIEIDGKDEEMVFLSNHLAWNAWTVAELYQSRWEIETFFKEIKQTLQLADFLGHNANAVRWQMWMGLLAHWLLRYWPLGELLDSYGTAPPPGRICGSPELAYLPGFG